MGYLTLTRIKISTSLCTGARAVLCFFHNCIIWRGSHRLLLILIAQALIRWRGRRSTPIAMCKPILIFRQRHLQGEALNHARIVTLTSVGRPDRRSSTCGTIPGCGGLSCAAVGGDRRICELLVPGLRSKRRCSSCSARVNGLVVSPLEVNTAHGKYEDHDHRSDEDTNRNPDGQLDCLFMAA